LQVFSNAAVSNTDQAMNYGSSPNIILIFKVVTMNCANLGAYTGLVNLIVKKRIALACDEHELVCLYVIAQVGFSYNNNTPYFE
jgi:hypothetical protein